MQILQQLIPNPQPLKQDECKTSNRDGVHASHVGQCEDHCSASGWDHRRAKHLDRQLLAYHWFDVLKAMYTHWKLTLKNGRVCTITIEHPSASAKDIEAELRKVCAEALEPINWQDVVDWEMAD